MFAFNDLPAADYTLSVRAAGYLSTPASHSLNLWSGPRLSGIDLYLEEAELAELSIDGPTIVQSGDAVGFGYAARTADGRQMGIDPQWSVDAPGAVDSVSADGVVIPKADFIGPLWVRLTDGYTDFSDSLLVHVMATIEPDDGARTFLIIGAASLSWTAPRWCSPPPSDSNIPSSLKSSGCSPITGPWAKSSPCNRPI